MLTLIFRVFFIIKEKQNAVHSRLFGISHKYQLFNFIKSILHMNIMHIRIRRNRDYNKKYKISFKSFISVE